MIIFGAVKNRISKKIPESVQIIFGVILYLFGPALLIFLTFKFEWLASIIFLITGIVLAATKMKKYILEKVGYALIFIAFFSFLGTAFDSAGNTIYNIPIARLCPAETELIRDLQVIKGYYATDEDSYAQQFSCFSATENRVVEIIPAWKSLGIRFLEYILLSLFFLGVFWVLLKLDKESKNKL